MAARVLAFVLAVAMVVGALAYRARQDEGNGGAGNGSGGGKAVVVCASELQPVCDDIGASTIEPAGDTADKLLSVSSRAEADLDAWVAPGPWAAMVDEGRSLASKEPLFDRAQPVAHTPLVAVLKKGRAPAGCEPPGTTWKCLGDAAQGPARIPGEASMGLWIRAAAVTGYVGRSDFDPLDFTEGEASDWLNKLDRALEDDKQGGARSLTAFLAASATAEAFLTTRAAATAAGAAEAFEVVVPQPVITLEAVLAPTNGGQKSAVESDKLRKSLVKQGWTAGPAPGGTGLPAPGVLLALRNFVA